MPNTARLALPYPVPADSADVPRDISALTSALDPKAAIFAQGLASARPAAGTQGRLYFATDTGVLSYDTGAAWTAVSIPGGATTVVTGALPSTPIDGQEIYYFPSGSDSLWYLRHNSGYQDGYPWQFVGGAPLNAEVVPACSWSSATYANPTAGTIGPQVTVPLAGYYDVDAGCMLNTGYGAKGSYAIAAIKNGAAATSDNDRVMQVTAEALSSTPDPAAALGGRRLRMLVAANAALLMQYRNNIATASAYNRYLNVTPVRVG